MKFMDEYRDAAAAHKLAREIGFVQRLEAQQKVSEQEMRQRRSRRIR